MASQRRFGSCRAAGVDWCNQARVWSHAEATTSPRCVCRWFSNHLEELQAPLVVVEQGEALINENDIIMHRMKFFKTIGPHVIGRGGRMLR